MTRMGWLTTTIIAGLVIGVSAAFHPASVLIWNASASVPVGLYAVRHPRALRLGQLVVAIPPEPLAGFLDDRGYLPRGVPLIKHVAGLPGQTICRTRRTITVNRDVLGTALEHDRRGRALPIWEGCHIIKLGEVFLMNPRRTDSLDGRYFGALATATIVGEAIPVWIGKGE